MNKTEREKIRERTRTLGRDNMKYARENARLHAEIRRLKERIEELEKE